MKILVSFIFLIGFCYCADDSESSDDYRREYVNDDYENYGRYYGHGDRSDRSRSISYPCSLHDIHCIQRVFAHNSRCSPPQGFRRDTINLKRLPLNLPHANLTLILNDAQIKGLRNWRIKEFYINRAMDRLVLEVVFDRIEVSSPKATVRVYRKGKEPVELVDSLTIEYEDTSFTLTIPHIKDLQLSQADVYTYLPNSNPKYALGPNIFSSNDPEVMLAIGELTGSVSLGIREAFTTQSNIIISVFLQSNICNFASHQTSA